jgi:TM2 domain-containing membrane protein YozV
VLSFFIPGLGQIYNGELGKGITIVVVTIASWMLTVIHIGFVILIPLWIWSMYDAYRTAEKINTLTQISTKVNAG